MILEQQIWKAKRGRRDEVVALARAAFARMGEPCRLLMPITHPGDLVILEFEHKDLGAHAQFWAAWNADPGYQAYQQELKALVEPEHRTELYQVL